MIRILAIFGIIWLYLGIRDYFFTEKVAFQKKGILEGCHIKYTKGVGKFEILIGVLFLLFDRVIPQIFGREYNVILLFAVMLLILIFFSKWSKQYKE